MLKIVLDNLAWTTLYPDGVVKRFLTKKEVMFLKENIAKFLRRKSITSDNSIIEG